VANPAGHRFLRPLLAGPHLYFIDHVLEDPETGAREGYFIARTRATVERAGVQHYPRRFDQAVPFAVDSEGNLLYGLGAVITRDAAPRFARGLGAARGR
jgi:hypothetical protein